MTTPNEGTGAVAPAPGSPEYDAAMAEKFRSSQSKVGEELASAFGQPPAAEQKTETKVAERPANVPEKFWDAATGTVRTDELLKSYTALETAKGAAPKADETPAPQTDANAAQEAVAAAGLDWNTISSKVAEKGTLEDTDFATLEKIGIPKDLVERIIANETAFAKLRQETAVQAAYEYTGGEEATTELLTWAAKSLTPAQIAGYNKMLAGDDWKVAVDTLKTLKSKATGSSEPNLVSTKSAPGGSVIGYQKDDEMRVDMRNPLYREMTPAGEKFRAEVAEKVRLAAYRRPAR